MNVQELIDQLNEVVDKTKPVEFQDSDYIGGMDCESISEKDTKVILCY